MTQTQCLESDIQFLKEWLQVAGYNLLVELFANAVKQHRWGPKVVVTVGEASVVIKGDCSKTEKRTERVTNDDVYRIDILLPIRTSVLKVPSGGSDNIQKKSVKCLPGTLTAVHPIKELFELRPNRHSIMVAVPDIEKTFQSNGLTGLKRYSHVLETVYKNPQGLIPRQKYIQPASVGDTFVFVEPVGALEWDVTCRDRLAPPRQVAVLFDTPTFILMQSLWCDWTIPFPWIMYPVILGTLILFTYLGILVSQFYM